MAMNPVRSYGAGDGLRVLIDLRWQRVCAVRQIEEIENISEIIKPLRCVEEINNILCSEIFENIWDITVAGDATVKYNYEC